MDKNKLKRHQISDKLEGLKEVKHRFVGVPSWIKYVRNGLNMGVDQLAKRLGLARSSVYQLERQEQEGGITLKKLEEVARALNCHLVYGLVPNDKLENLIDVQAGKRAEKLLKEVNLQMELEAQEVDKEKLKRRYDELKEKIKTSKKLWDQ